MSPRRTRPPRRSSSNSTTPEENAPTTGVESVESDADGEEWVVRRITGSSSTKTYRCPGCDQEIRPATPHVVAWPREALDQRRHWHSSCWQARNRRGAKQFRSGR